MRPSPSLAYALLSGALLVGLGPGALEAQPGATKRLEQPRFAGMALTDALQWFQERDLHIVFTSRVVRPTMKVENEPAPTQNLRELLDRLLSPHGLVAKDGPKGALVVVRIEPQEGAGSEATGSPGQGVPSPIPIITEELVITPSKVSLLREEPVGSLELGRDEILALPHLGDDFYRALTLLPGITGNDVSAQFHVRGGRRDETQILIDGQELYDAYHLKDFDSGLSFIAPDALGTADLTTGGFSAQYGDRMSGVLDMTTVVPSGDRSFRVGVSILGFQAGTTGTFHKNRGAWLAEARRGSFDLVGQLLGDEDPSFWDAFAKLAYQIDDRNSLRGHGLHTGDEFDFEKLIDGDFNRFVTEYDSTYLWLTNQTILSRKLFFETAGSVARIDRDRTGIELEEDAAFTILDKRNVDVLSLRQNWNLQLSPKQSLTWGWEARNFESLYDYFGDRNFDNPLAQIRHDSTQGTTTFQGAFDEDHNTAFIVDRFRPAKDLTLELGLRYDEQTQTRESIASPRFNLAWAPGQRNVLRAAWGRFNQSQRPYELQVEDGETGFHPVERSEHRVLGFEKLFENDSGDPGIALRIELYQREVKNPRRRYENLYEPINTFPEVEPDRVLIDPQRSLAEGLEVFLRGDLGPKLSWWATYSYSTTEDLIDGRWTPRIFDQTHGLNLDADYRIDDHWRINLAWRYHTGWPTTPLSVQEVVDDEGETEFVPVLGALNSERLTDYHRLDFRVSRRWQTRSANVDFFIDFQNAYDRSNPAGFDFEIDDEDGTINSESEDWTGILPSAGISIAF